MDRQEFLLETYLQEINKIALLSAQEEKELALRYKQGDLKARERLITANLRLVVKMARRYRGCGLPLLDLIEEGNLGLIKAVERFDASKNCRFSTYATCWIKHSICRALSDKNQVIRIPLYMKKLITRCKEQIPVLTEKFGRPPTLTEIVDSLHLSAEKSAMLKRALLTARSLDRIRSLSMINFYKDSVEDPRVGQQSERRLNLSEFEVVEKHLDSMEPKKAQILRMRFGLRNFRPMTLKEVGEKLHLTKERVRQIEKEAIKRLKFTIEKNREVAQKRRHLRLAKVM